MTNKQDYNSFDIAVIGISCRFPGAKNIQEFWSNLENGVESISFFSKEELIANGADPQQIKDPNYIPAGGVLQDANKFDANLFGFFPREVELMDPQHRLFLECCWEAWEDAGYNSEHFQGLVGVFGGCTMNTYLVENVLKNKKILSSAGHLQVMIGNDKDFITSRVSHKLNLKGPSYTVQTACSTSLYAVHVATNSLIAGECDIALAGGSSIRVPQSRGYLYQPSGTSSPDGHCRAFDINANGSVVGCGAGIVVLKRLFNAIDDGDHIYAIIKGSAVSHDGSDKAAFSTPSVQGQARAITGALAISGVNPESIQYVEAHGTATNIGDPIEVAALTKAYRDYTQKKNFCVLGSVKTNIGHLDAAAGISGLIKVILSMRAKKFPLLLNFQSPNPQLDLENSPFYINKSLEDWPALETPRRAGVTSIGLGGANAHVIIEEAPILPEIEQLKENQLIVLSAKTETALNNIKKNLHDFLEANPSSNLTDMAFTLQVGRAGLEYRYSYVCDSISELKNELQKQMLSPTFVLDKTKNKLVAFLFPGQGSQYHNMMKDLYEKESIFKEIVDHCSEILKKYTKADIREIIFSSKDEGKINQTKITQPSIFVIEYALARLLKTWGITPDLMIGHSIGEIVASCLAGVFSLEDALKLIAYRGIITQSLEGGAMLSVNLPEKIALQYVDNEKISLSAVNSQTQCVLSGREKDINALQNMLASKGIETHFLKTSHAFHSHMMDDGLKQYREILSTITLCEPSAKIMSTVTGDFLHAEQATDVEYWIKHLRNTVRFSDAIVKSLKDREYMCVEVGPGNILNNLAKSNLESSQNCFISLFPKKSVDLQEHKSLLHGIGQFWSHGGKIHWTSLHGVKCRRISLPTYPFEKKPFWIEPESEMVSSSKILSTENNPSYLNINIGEMVDAFKQIFSSVSDVNLSIPLTTNQKGVSCLRKEEGTHFTTEKYHNDKEEMPSSKNLSVEEKLIVICKELLGVSYINLEDNLIDLGAHSLLMTQLLSRIKNEFNCILTMEELFNASTIRDIRTLISRDDKTSEVTSHESANNESTLETELKTIIEDLLGEKIPSNDTSILDMGAHSLLITQLLSRLKTRFSVDLSIQSLFENPTINKMKVLLLPDKGAQIHKTKIDDLYSAMKDLDPNEIEKLLREED